MWIIPKSLVSSGSTDTVETSSDLNELSQICVKSLSVRGTLSSLRTWSAKWKRDSWTRFLSGRIVRISPSNLSKIESIFLSRPIRARVSAMPAKDSEPMTSATSGPTAGNGFREQDPELFSSKTSRDTFRLDSPQSSLTWKKMVIQRRGEFSARLKSARLTSGKEFLSWPTTAVMDTPGMSTPGMSTPGMSTPGMSMERDGNPTGRIDQLPRAVYAEKSQWMTPRACEAENPPMGDRNHQGLTHQVKSGLPAPDRHNSPGSRPEPLWASPRSAGSAGSAGSKNVVYEPGKKPTVDGRAITTTLTDQVRQTGKLNPRWVEVLMGIPMGWTSPDCPASVILNWPKFVNGWLRAQTEQTNSACVETESCPTQRKELSGSSTRNLRGQGELF